VNASVLDDGVCRPGVTILGLAHAPGVDHRDGADVPPELQVRVPYENDGCVAPTGFTKPLGRVGSQILVKRVRRRGMNKQMAMPPLIQEEPSGKSRQVGDVIVRRFGAGEGVGGFRQPLECRTAARTGPVGEGAVVVSLHRDGAGTPDQPDARNGIGPIGNQVPKTDQLIPYFGIEDGPESGEVPVDVGDHQRAHSQVLALSCAACRVHPSMPQKTPVRPSGQTGVITRLARLLGELHRRFPSMVEV